jgi:ABC-type branched-subunit amino acid transport system substrate-binding protein
MKYFIALTMAGIVLAGLNGAAEAQKKYDPGASDTEIKIGQTMSYSGPLAAFGLEGRVESAYFAMLNESGGINGRKVTLLSNDDGYSPPKTVEQTRKMVESDNVLAIVSSLGTAPNIAIQKYLNAKKVPQLLVLSGVSRWDDPKGAPWSMSFLPAYESEAKIFAKYLLQNHPDAKIGTLTLNGDVGGDFMRGLHEGLGDKAATMIVKETTYDSTDTSVDSQILSLHDAGVDTLLLAAVGKFPAQAIRKSYDIGWKPLTMLFSPASTIKTSLEPAGPLERSTGFMSTVWLKAPSSPQWADDKGAQSYLGFMKKYLPDVNPDDEVPALGYSAAQLAAYILRQCGDDLTRENLMRQATSLKDVSLDLTLPGVTLNNSTTSRNPIKQFQMVRFNGKEWEPVGPILHTEEVAH